MTDWYREDQAYIHEVGHADFALRSAPGILKVLKEYGVPDGLVVDLGCGSGLWARELPRAGYRVLGIDISEAMVEITRQGQSSGWGPSSKRRSRRATLSRPWARS